LVAARRLRIVFELSPIRTLRTGTRIPEYGSHAIRGAILNQVGIEPAPIHHARYGVRLCSERLAEKAFRPVYIACGREQEIETMHMINKGRGR
jgi:hypothetical protein